MEFHPFSTRRERQLDERINEIANAAILEALEMRAEGTGQLFRVQIPPRPGRLKPDKYLERVQDSVSATLGKMGCENLMECDEEMSESLNAAGHDGPVSTNVFTRRYRNDVPLLVFRSPQTA
jgi:phenylalanyl-tRNA synthetase beta subunit